MERVFIHAVTAAATAAMAGVAKRKRTGRTIVNLLAHKALEMLQLPHVNGFVGGRKKHRLA